MPVQCRPKRLPRAIDCRLAILSRCCKPSSGMGFSKVFADRTAGYELGRAGDQISADDILRAASGVEEADEPPLPGSALVNEVIRPALAETE